MRHSAIASRSLPIVRLADGTGIADFNLMRETRWNVNQTATFAFSSKITSVYRDD